MVSSYDALIRFSVLQVDSDLIFDSIEESNNVYSHDRHQRDLSSSVDTSHVEDEQHWFSGTLHRIKRHLGSIFNGGEPEENKHQRRTRQDDQDFLEQGDYEEEEDNVSYHLNKVNRNDFVSV